MVRRLTSKELAKRIIKEKTENIALQCVKCRAMYEIENKFSNGCICSYCGSPCKAIGFLSPAKAHKKSHTQHEAAEQEALFRWASYQYGIYPELRLMHHIPNGGSRNKQEASNLKSKVLNQECRTYVCQFLVENIMDYISR